MDALDSYSEKGAFGARIIELFDDQLSFRAAVFSAAATTCS